MPLKKEQFIKVYDDLAKRIDVDDSRGRSVPINMNFIETGYLTKDTGSSLFGSTSASLAHSMFNYKKKNGTSYFIRGMGTKLQRYNTSTLVWDDLAPTYTAGARFGFVVYDDVLYGCNGVEAFFSWDGTTFTNIGSAPLGNILEIFEDRIFVSGVAAEPLTIYYSGTGAPISWTGTDILKPLGTDSVTNLKNFYGTLLIFKTDTIWKMTFEYNQLTSTFLPKLTLQSGNYGACSRNAVSWVENDLWFFTGLEVRSIGFKDQQVGVFGVNKSVISDNIKETLKGITIANYSSISVFYFNRKFYLSIPLSSSTNDTVFICHLLYNNAWTKYTSRIKASANNFIAVDGIVYSTKSAAPFGILKWSDTSLSDNGTAISSEVFFKNDEDKDFNKFNIYRYLDLMFKDLTANVTVTIKEDANDLRTSKTKQFFVGSTLENELSTLGEVDPGESLVGDGYGQNIESSPFQKKRVSFLSKAQTLTIGLSNNRAGETFTIAEYVLYGTKEPRKMFKPSGIVSLA